MLKNNHIHQERKTLHKVKRQWVILSAVTLLGTAGITSINVNAASNLASDTKTTSSLANTTAGYSNAAATLGEAASNAMNRLATNISAINSYASIRTTLSDNKNSQASAAISSVVASAHSDSLSAQSAFDQIKVANVIASAANMPGGTLEDAAKAASQASAAFTGLMNNLASTDRLVGNMSNAIYQIENPSSSSADNSSTSTTTNSSSTTKSTTSTTNTSTTTANTNTTTTNSTSKSSETHSSASATTSSAASNSNNSSSSVSATPYTETKATSSAVSAAKKSIANAKRQVKLAKTAKAKAKANKLLKRAQRNLLIVQNNYNYNYYYYFDGPFDTVTTKKSLYVYSNKHLVKKYRIKKIPKGTTISVFKVLTDDNSSVFKVTGGNYITGKRSFFTK